MDSIFTTMKNFQDVFHQALLCDKGVYCSAKERQLLRPDGFGSIWIGKGPFHCDRSKILIAANEKFLDQALYKSAAFLKGKAETSIMKGGDYSYGKDGMSVIAEA